VLIHKYLLSSQRRVFIETSMTIYQLTMCNIPEEMNLLKHRCENLATRIFLSCNAAHWRIFIYSITKNQKPTEYTL